MDGKEIADAISTLEAIDVDSKKFYGDFILQKVYHDFLRQISIVDNSENEKAEIILYNLGKFSQVINDFETIYYATLPKNKLRNFCGFWNTLRKDFILKGILQILTSAQMRLTL